MTTRFKKHKKKSGHVSAGHGRFGKHCKHPRVRKCWRNALPPYPLRQVPFRIFDKMGMRYFHKLQNKFFCPTINMEKLWTLVPAEVQAQAQKSKDCIPMIDVTQYTYFKVLGKDVLPPAQPVVVKAKLISKIAKKKIKKVGGAVLLVK